MLAKGQSDFDGSVGERFGAIDAYDTGRLDAGTASLFFGELLGTGEVELQILAFSDGGFHGEYKQGTAVGDVDAFSIEEASGLGMPDADGPMHVSPLGTTLFMSTNHDSPSFPKRCVVGVAIDGPPFDPY